MDKTVQTLWDVWKKNILDETQFIFAFSGEHFDFTVQNSPDPEEPTPNLLGISIIANTPLAADVIRLAFLYRSPTYMGKLLVFHNMENDRPLVMVGIRSPVLDKIAAADSMLTVPVDTDSLQQLYQPFVETIVYRANVVRKVYQKLNIIFDDTRTCHLDNQEFYNAFIHPTMEVIS
jgi:hypothetical protein